MDDLWDMPSQLLGVQDMRIEKTFIVSSCRHIPGFLSELIWVGILKLALSRDLHQIKVIDFQYAREGDSELFFNLVGSSLDLIREVTASRYNLIPKEIDFIVKVRREESFGARYFSWSKVCQFNVAEIDDSEIAEHFDYWVRYLSCLLIHEMTHGRLISHGIWTSEKNHSRIERLCVLEQIRFAKRLCERDCRWTVEQLVPNLDAKLHGG